jgi:hypothetical protein
MEVVRGKTQTYADDRVGRGRKLPVHLGLVHHGSVDHRRVSGLCFRLGRTTYYFSVH